MTTVRTNLGNTRERAGQLRFEPSASISATNVQDAITEVLAATLPSLTTPTVVTTTGIIAPTDVIVQTNQAAAIMRTLPLSTAWATQYGRYGIPLIVVDISGTASVNNVTIDATGGELIDGLSSVVISTDYGGYRFLPKSGGGWVVV